MSRTNTLNVLKLHPIFEVIWKEVRICYFEFRCTNLNFNAAKHIDKTLIVLPGYSILINRIHNEVQGKLFVWFKKCLSLKKTQNGWGEESPILSPFCLEGWLEKVGLSDICCKQDFFFFKSNSADTIVFTYFICQ